MRKLYEILKILQIQKRMFSAGSIHKNTVAVFSEMIWILILVWKTHLLFRIFKNHIKNISVLWTEKSLNDMHVLYFYTLSNCTKQTGYFLIWVSSKDRMLLGIQMNSTLVLHNTYGYENLIVYLLLCIWRVMAS